MDLVGVAEIAEMLSVTRQRVNELVRSDPTFPAPVAELSAGRIWLRETVETWMATRNTTPGRPRQRPSDG